MEPLRPTPDQAAIADMGRELDRIEAAVDAGDRDLRALGFWRVVGASSVTAWRSSATPTRPGASTRPRSARASERVFAPGSGVILMVLLSLAGILGVVLAATWTGTWAGLALLGAGVAWSVGWHLPAPAFVGWLAGIRFTDAFLGGPPPPRPGIKTDYASYLRAEPSMRAWFHASGAIATKLAPFVALALWPATNAPAWSAWALLALGVLQIVTDITLSTKSSDWKKFRRERGVARDIQASLSRI